MEVFFPFFFFFTEKKILDNVVRKKNYKLTKFKITNIFNFKIINEKYKHLNSKIRKQTLLKSRENVIQNKTIIVFGI